MSKLSFDKRILVTVVIFLALAVFGVAAVRPISREVIWFERFSPQSAASAEKVRNGLSLSINDTSIRLLVPNCQPELFQEKFFLHIYPRATQSAVPVNLDFFLSQEKGRKVSTANGTACMYEKHFKGLNASEVVIGQFELQGDRCCRIIWSRNFFLESGR